ncbi:SCO6880 family protein [Parafrankia sp. FMc6]|uniref:SCO6880 family protein n=1 Tax=Parafrankia soli TaxID=2599596 RepID=UPI0034D4BE2D
MTSSPVYRLARRRSGMAHFGLGPAPLILVAGGFTALIVLPLLTGSLVVGAAVAAGCGMAAFVPVPGAGPLYEAAPLVVRHLARRTGARHHWVAPLPLLSGAPAAVERPGDKAGRLLPPPLRGLEILTVPRTAATGAAHSLTPIGLIHDRRAGTLAAVLSSRGSEFGLLETADQHDRLSAWAQVLAHTARDSGVARLGWSLWSGPTPPSDHLLWLHDRQSGTATADHGPDQAAEDYQRLLENAAPALTRHDLRLWLSLDTRRLHRRAAPLDAAVQAALTFAERCRAAGLVVGDPDSPVDIAEALRLRADPSVAATLTRVRHTLAQQSGAISVLAGVHAGPLSMHARWNAVRIDDVWHRTFWVAQWPTAGLRPGWLDPLLFDASCVRTVAFVLEPVPARASRRRINADAVELESRMAVRERHGFRVPTHLAGAQAQVDEREAELHSGHVEYGYVALVDVTAPTLDDLDDASTQLAEAAAFAGVSEIRPLHGRHDLAWAATLPTGRVPARGLLR